MKIKRSFRSFTLRRFATACLCWFAYLLLTLHEIIPHHHENDVEHQHQHSGHTTHSHAHNIHKVQRHGELKKNEADKECLLLIHHVTDNENFISPSTQKKKIAGYYYLAGSSLFVTIDRGIISYSTPHSSSPVLQRETRIVSLRGPPHA